MPEDKSHEPPKDRSPLQANKDLARQILKTLGQESLGDYETRLKMQHLIVESGRAKFGRIHPTTGPNQSPIHCIPDRIEAGKLLQTAWIGTPASHGENPNIVNFRLHKPKGITTRSTKTESRDSRGRDVVTHDANHEGTVRLIGQLVVDLGFEIPQLTTDETLAKLRSTLKFGDGKIEFTGRDTPELRMTITRPENTNDQVANPIDAAYRIQIQRLLEPKPQTPAI
jgi:hypothetical protein